MQKNDIFKKLIKCPINMAGKYTIATCNVNSYQTFTK